MTSDMSPSKKIVMILLLSFCFAGFAQDETAPREWRYNIPFPESNFRGDWQFTLVAGPELAEDYTLTVFSYNAYGELIKKAEPVQLSNGLPYVWHESPAGNKAQVELRTQTLVLVSDHVFDGVLWIQNEVLDLLNAVSITDTTNKELFISHIPNDFFTWNTSFVVQGIAGQANKNADIIFDYFNNSRRSGSVEAWTGLDDNAYFKGSPFRDIFINGLDVVSWGKVRVAQPGSDFRLTGYQTFLKSTDGLQGAALELVSEPSFKGFFGFSHHEDWQFSEWFAFTNPNSLAARIWLTLYYVPTGMEEVVTATAPVNLPAGNRHNLILGNDLFPEIQGRYIGMEYRSYVPSSSGPDEIELPIMISHLQSDTKAIALGAHGPQKRGNRSVAFLGGPEFEQRLDLFNPLFEAITIDLSITFSENLAPITKSVDIIAGGELSLSYYGIKEEIQAVLDANPGATLLPAIRVDMDSPRALFYNKLTGYHEGDFGIANPVMHRLKVEF